ALDEEMAEWLFDLLAEAACSLVMDDGSGAADDKPSYVVMAALELPLQANLAQPLRLKIDPVATADLLHKHLHLPAGPVVMIEPPVYAAYAMFDAQNAVRLHRLADETVAVWRDLEASTRSRTIVHLHTQCGNGVYMPIWTDLFDPDLPEDHGPAWTSPDVWVFTADLPIEWPGEMLTNRLLAEGCTRFENHIVEAPEN